MTSSAQRSTSLSKLHVRPRVSLSQLHGTRPHCVTSRHVRCVTGGCHWRPALGVSRLSDPSVTSPRSALSSTRVWVESCPTHWSGALRVREPRAACPGAARCVSEARRGAATGRATTARSDVQAPSVHPAGRYEHQSTMMDTDVKHAAVIARDIPPCFGTMCAWCVMRDNSVTGRLSVPRAHGETDSRPDRPGPSCGQRHVERHGRPAPHVSCRPCRVGRVVPRRALLCPHGH